MPLECPPAFMKGAHAVVKLEQLVGEFSSGLFGLYNLAGEEVGRVGVERPRWLQSYLIFCALERCRGLVGGPAEHIRCRFSLGKRAPGDPGELEAYLHQFRRLNQSITLRPEQLKEHFVDFSMSVGTVEQGWGDDDLPAGVKFRLLLAAESEINEGFGKDVLEDGLKLLDTIAPVKVLIFPSCSDDGARRGREERLVKLVNAHGPEGHQDGYRWLFIGAPKFDDWQDQGGNPSRLSRQVYTLAPRATGQDYALEDMTALWTDHVPDL